MAYSAKTYFAKVVMGNPYGQSSEKNLLAARRHGAADQNAT
jgi:hypothetical protein